jgi:hypothetical protein
MRSIGVDPRRKIMMRDRETEVQELTLDQLEVVAGGSLMDTVKLMSEILSNVSKTRSEISMTFARNARA